VNFGATLLETNDLSTIRGGSLALLALEEKVAAALEGRRSGKTELLYAGASQCAFRLTTTETAAALRQAVVTALDRAKPGQDPAAHLCTVVDVVEIPGGDENLALKQAEACNHARQFRQWTLDPLPFVDTARDACALDGMRPAFTEEKRPDPKRRQPHFLLNEKEDSKASGGFERRKLSAAVSAKRRHGRRARQDFYASEQGIGAAAFHRSLGLEDGKRLYLTDSLQDMVASPPKELPLSLRNKVAVVYADGNGFGSLRDKIGVETFSGGLKALRRDLLARILTWFRQGYDTHASRSLFTVTDRTATDQDQGRTGLRLETLLWGGDEAMFVMPSWLALPFAQGLSEVMTPLTLEGHALTHAMSVIIADRKTPIRQMTALAYSAAEHAKKAGLKDQSSLSIDIFESTAPPDLTAALGAVRAALYGLPEEGAEALVKALAFPGDCASLSDIFARLKGLGGGVGQEGQNSQDGFPHSQLYKILRDAQYRGRISLFDREANEKAKQALEDYEKRMGPKDSSPLAHLLPALVERPLLVDLALMAQLWDYVHPGGLSIMSSFPPAPPESAPFGSP